MSKENMIIWQKWMDPFGSDETEAIEELSAIFHDDEEIDEDIDEDGNIESPHNKLHKSMPVRVMATPMGIIPITDNTASGKIFNFWLGHTNFNITKKIAQTIEGIDGVETLDVFTRYRFRIGVGKAFSDSEVMRDINKQLYDILDHVK